MKQEIFRICEANKLWNEESIFVPPKPKKQRTNIQSLPALQEITNIHHNNYHNKNNPKYHAQQQRTRPIPSRPSNTAAPICIFHRSPNSSNISFKTFSSSLFKKNDLERLVHSILFMS